MNILETFKSIADSCRQNNLTTLTLNQVSYTLDALDLDQYLQEQTFLIDADVAHLKKLAESILNIKMLPTTLEDRQNLILTLSEQLTEIKAAHDNICNIHQIFMRMKADVDKVRDRYSIEHKKKEKHKIQTHFATLIKNLTENYNLLPLTDALARFKDDLILENFIALYEQAHHKIHEAGYTLETDEKLAEENYLECLQQCYLEVEEEFKILVKHYNALVNRLQNLETLKACQVAILKAMETVEEHYAMPLLEKILPLYATDKNLTELAKEHEEKIAKLKNFHLTFNNSEPSELETLIKQAPSVKAELPATLRDLATLGQALKARVRFNLYMTKFKQELQQFDKTVLSLDLNKLKKHIGKHQASEDLQHQLKLFTDNKIKFSEVQQKIIHTSFEPHELSNLVNLKEELNEAVNHMKAAYQAIPNLRDASQTETAVVLSKNFLKRHWAKLLAAGILGGFMAVGILILSGGLLPFAMGLATALGINTPLAAVIATSFTTLMGGALGAAASSIACVKITDNVPPPKVFWQHHAKDIATGIGIGLTVSAAVVGLTFLTLAAFGIGPLVALSAIGTATAASLTAFGANITVAAGIGIAVSFFTATVLSLSSTVTAFSAMIFDSRKKPLPSADDKPNAQILTEVINPDIESKSFSQASIKHVLRQKPDFPEEKKPEQPAKTTTLSDEDLADLLYSFEDQPSVSQSGHGFLNQPREPIEHHGPDKGAQAAYNLR